MKKIFIVIMVCFMALSLSMGAFADGEYANAGELVQVWLRSSGNNYPEGVCGIWSTDGSLENITVAVTKDEQGERAKAKIISSVRDASGFSFTTHKYTYAQLCEARDMITEYITSWEGEELGVAGWGIYERENCVHVDIIVSKPGAEDFMRWGYENFGDMILFESVDGYPVPAAAELGVGEKESGITGIIVAAGGCAVIAAAVVVFRRKLFPQKDNNAAG